MKVRIGIALVALLALPLALLAYDAGAFTNPSTQRPLTAATVKPKTTFSLEKAKVFEKFPLYYAGAAFERLPLIAVHRIDAPEVPDEEVRRDDVSFLYGCTPTSDGGCSPPVQIQIWNACERYPAVYATEPDETVLVRGVPAAFYENSTRLELYSGLVTIVIFGDDREQVLRVARTLRGVNHAVDTAEALPQPHAGVREGLIACQQP
jgi:hypothetical protein